MELFDAARGQRAFHSGAKRDVSSSLTINQDNAKAYNGTTITITNNPTITLNADLPGDFGCTVIPPASGDVTIAVGTGVTINGGSTPLTRDLADNSAGFALYASGAVANSYTVSGS